MGGIDGAEVRAEMVAENNGVHQTAGAGDDRGAAAGATEDGDVPTATDVEIHFVGEVRGAAGDDDQFARFPEAEEFRRLSQDYFRQHQSQRFVERDVFSGGSES